MKRGKLHVRRVRAVELILLVFCLINPVFIFDFKVDLGLRRLQLNLLNLETTFIWTQDSEGNHHVSVVSKVDWSIGCVVGLFFCVQCTGAVGKALAIDHNSVVPPRDQPSSKLCDKNI